MAAAMRRVPGIVKEWASPRWKTFVYYGKYELTPPTPGEIPEAFSKAAQLVKSATTFQWRKFTVKEAWLNILVAAEVGCWFFIGECIGKRKEGRILFLSRFLKAFTVSLSETVLASPLA